MAVLVTSILDTLQGQLAGGGQDQGLDLGVAGVDGVEQGQSEGGGLAGAGLGHAHDVATGQEHRDGLLLDGGGRDVAHVGHGAQQVRGQAEVGEGGAGLLRRLAAVLDAGARLGGGGGVGGLVVDEGGVAVDLLLIHLGAVVLLLAALGALGIGLGKVALDVVLLVLVLDVLGIAGGLRGGGSGEVLGRAGGIRRGGRSGLGGGGWDDLVLPAGGLRGEEGVKTQGLVAGAHDVFPVSVPMAWKGTAEECGGGLVPSALAAPGPPHSPCTGVELGD